MNDLTRVQPLPDWAQILSIVIASLAIFLWVRMKSVDKKEKLWNLNMH